MPSYSPPVKDTLFVLNNVLHLERYTNLPGFAGAEPEMVEAILTEGGRFCAEVIKPTNQTGDREGCTRNADGSVTTPSGFKQAYDQLVAGGWTALSGPEAYGGQALPHVVSTAFEEYLISANQAFAMYPGLTAGATGATLAKARQEMKARLGRHMVSGQRGGKR